MLGKHIEFVKLQLMQGYRASARNISYIFIYLFIIIDVYSIYSACPECK